MNRDIRGCIPFRRGSPVFLSAYLKVDICIDKTRWWIQNAGSFHLESCNVSLLWWKGDHIALLPFTLWNVLNFSWEVHRSLLTNNFKKWVLANKYSFFLLKCKFHFWSLFCSMGPGLLACLTVTRMLVKLCLTSCATKNGIPKLKMKNNHNRTTLSSVAKFFNHFLLILKTWIFMVILTFSFFKNKVLFILVTIFQNSCFAVACTPWW